MGLEAAIVRVLSSNEIEWKGPSVPLDSRRRNRREKEVISDEGTPLNKNIISAHFHHQIGCSWTHAGKRGQDAI